MFSVINDDVQRNELEEFYKENKNCLLNIALLNLQNKSDAEDVVQEAFCEIAYNPDVFFGVAPNFRVNFIVAVIRNLSCDMIGKRNKTPIEKLDETDFYDDDFFSSEEIMIGNVSSDKLKQFIQSLPPLQRDVLTFRCLMGFSTAETAEKLNISVSAVKKRLHLAKESIRKFVQKEDKIYD